MVGLKWSWITSEQEKRFHQRYIQRNRDECWEWTNSKNPAGYGEMRIGNWKDETGKIARAHRIAWVLHNERDIPSHGVICHRCDCRECVNPHHLYLGTDKSNVMDMLERNRNKKYFTREQVTDMRRKYKSGVKMKVLMKEYSIPRNRLWYILVGKTYAWVKEKPVKTTQEQYYLPDELKAKIIKYLENGGHAIRIAEKLKTNIPTLTRALGLKKIKDVKPLKEKDNTPKRKYKKNRAKYSDFSKAKKKKIRRMYQRGVTKKQLADILGISTTLVRRILGK